MTSRHRSCRQPFPPPGRPRSGLRARYRNGRSSRPTCHIASPMQRMRSRDTRDRVEDRDPCRLCRSRGPNLESAMSSIATSAVPARLLHLREGNGDCRFAVLEGRSQRKAEIPRRRRNALIWTQNGLLWEFRFLPAGSTLLIVRIQCENVTVRHFVLHGNARTEDSRQTREAYSYSYDPNNTSKKHSL